MVEKLKSFMVTTMCFYLATASSNEQQPNNNNSAQVFMGGRSRSNSVEEITLQVPYLGPQFAVFLRSVFMTDFQEVESFTVQVNQLTDA